MEFRLLCRTRRTRCRLLLRKPDGMILRGRCALVFSVPMHSRVTLRALPRLINSGLFSQRSQIVQRDIFYLSPLLPLVRRGILFRFSPPTYPRTSGRRLVLEIKGLARQENLYQETHWATSWILENWKSVNPRHPSTMNPRLVRALGAYRGRLWLNLNDIKCASWN